MPINNPSSPQPVVACWSGGKDSALMLDRLRRDSQYRVVGLLTMVTAGDRRISMHGVSAELLRRQAEAIGLPLITAEIPPFPANAIYEAAFAKGVDRFRSLGVQTIAFGDLFLADIRSYREQLCQRIGLEPLFPLWNEPTDRLAAEFVDRGFRAVVCCVDGAKLSREFVGCGYDAVFVSRLPVGVDPCGENGEFHTFVTVGPILSEPVPVEVTAVSQSQGFWYAELQPPRPQPAEDVKLSSTPRPRTVPLKEQVHV